MNHFQTVAKQNFYHAYCKYQTNKLRLPHNHHNDDYHSHYLAHISVHPQFHTWHEIGRKTRVDIAHNPDNLKIKINIKPFKKRSDLKLTIEGLFFNPNFTTIVRFDVLETFTSFTFSSLFPFTFTFSVSISRSRTSPFLLLVSVSVNQLLKN